MGHGVGTSLSHVSPSECRQATHAAHKKCFGTEAPRERDRDTQHCGVSVALRRGHAMGLKRGTSGVQGFACCSTPSPLCLLHVPVTAVQTAHHSAALPPPLHYRDPIRTAC